jgi:hypothetical protein
MVRSLPTATTFAVLMATTIAAQPAPARELAGQPVERERWSRRGRRPRACWRRGRSSAGSEARSGREAEGSPPFQPWERSRQPSPSLPRPPRAPVCGGPSTRSHTNRVVQLRKRIRLELSQPPISRASVSLLAWSLESQPVERSEKPRVWPTRFATPDQLNPRAPGAPPSPPRQLIAIQPNTPRVPASNAKLFATVAAAKLLRDTYRFVTEISVAKNGGPLYVWGTGDPLFDRADLAKLAQQVSAKGLNSVRGIVIDDSHFGARRLAPGFEQFDESAYYRPPSGALNLDSNILHIRVSADRRRKTPRVQVFPASEYVKVRKRIRFAAARSGSAARRRSVRIRSEEASAHMWLVVEGTFGVRARHFSTRRPVLDPSLNFGWALRRALKEHGIEVLGPVWRGRKPPGSRVIAELRTPTRCRARGDEHQQRQPGRGGARQGYRSSRSGERIPGAGKLESGSEAHARTLAQGVRHLWASVAQRLRVAPQLEGDSQRSLCAVERGTRARAAEKADASHHGARRAARDARSAAARRHHAGPCLRQDRDPLGGARAQRSNYPRRAPSRRLFAPGQRQLESTHPAPNRPRRHATGTLCAEPPTWRRCYRTAPPSHPEPHQ